MEMCDTESEQSILTNIRGSLSKRLASWEASPAPAEASAMKSSFLHLLLMVNLASTSALFSTSDADGDKTMKTPMYRLRERLHASSAVEDASCTNNDLQLSSGFGNTRSSECQGVMFDVYVPSSDASEDVRIFAFDLNLDRSETHEVEVYSRLGTHVEHENSIDGWTSLGVYSVDGQDRGEPTRLELSAAVLVKPGEVLAFYFAQLNDDEFKVFNREDDGVGAVLASNSDLDVLVGTCKDDNSDPFEDDNEEGMGFSGVVHYRLCGSSTPRPTPSPVPSPTSQPTTIDEEYVRLTMNFQLKMFWEEGMEWQGSTREKAWCMEITGDETEIKECDDDEDDQRWYFFEGQIKPFDDTDICMTHSRKKVTLEDCNGSQSQQWVGFRERSPGKFQLKPITDLTKCLTQQHHPRSGEDLFVYDCNVAEQNDRGRYDDTSHWIIGNFDGHR